MLSFNNTEHKVHKVDLVQQTRVRMMIKAYPPLIYASTH